MRARRPRGPFLILSAILLLAAGCLHGRGEGEEPQPEAPRIEVRNRYFGPIVAYLVVGGNSARLGLVQAGRTETFVFPIGFNPYGPGIRLVADPVGDFEAYRSEVIAVNGSLVVMTVENQLRMSWIEVR